MPFSTRNALYLRISSWTVLPLYLYLDERHVHWMTDQILQAVLADLRPKLAKKFHDEQPTKKSTVEVHRGGNYQFAFFFRKTNSRHVVLLKKREFHLQPVAPSIKGSEMEPATPEPASRKRKRTSVSKTPARENGRASVPSSPFTRKKRGPEREGQDHSDVGEDEDATATTTPRRSTRAASRVQYAENENANDEFEGDDDALVEVAAEYDQAVVKDEPVEEGDGDFEMEGLESMEKDEEEEDEDLDEKKDFKPVMKLSYTGFSISSRHLVLIVEPWPPLATLDRAPIRPRSTFSRSMSRDIGLAAYDRSSTIASAAGDSRSQTPLVPNSRRGGTGSVAWSATPGVGVGDMMRGATPIVANSRSGGRGAAVSSTPGPSTPGMMGPPSAVRRATPLFRDAPPFSEAGDVAELDDDEDDEDTRWRRRARSSSWAPWRGEFVEPERQGQREEDEEEAANLAEARGMLAMSQSLQTNTGQRGGSVFTDSGGDMDEAEDEGDEGADVDDVGGGD